MSRPYNELSSRKHEQKLISLTRLLQSVQSTLLELSITDLVRVQMDEVDTYTIAEFCVRNRICRAYYYKLRPLGLAPAEMRLGSKVVISKEAAAVWRRKMETANSKPPAADAVACFNETEQLDGVCRRAYQPPVPQNVRGTPKHPERERRRPMSTAEDGSKTQKRSVQKIAAMRMEA